MMGVCPWRGRGDVRGEGWGRGRWRQLVAPRDVGPHVLRQNGGKRGDGERRVLCIAFGDGCCSLRGHGRRGLDW